MGMQGDQWLVQSGDCLWKIAANVYGNGARWPEIAEANGLATSGNPIIYPGQLFDLPGITQGAPAPDPEPAPPPPTPEAVRIDWFMVTAGSKRNMECLWYWSRQPQRFWIKWEYYDSNGHKWVKSETQDYSPTTGETPQAQCNFDDIAKRSRVSIRPVEDNIVIDEQGNPHVEGIKFQDNTQWAVKEYDFTKIPPDLPPSPEFSIDQNNKIVVEFNNIPQELDADKIQVSIYQDNNNNSFQVYKNITVNINQDLRYAVCRLDALTGHKYKVRCRSFKSSINTYSGWTNFSNVDMTRPGNIDSKKFILEARSYIEQGVTTYGVYTKWAKPDNTAKTYQIQWTTNKAYFDTPSSEVHEHTTQEEDGEQYLITDINVGHRYYFRIRAINDKGTSLKWSGIKEIVIGSKPTSPTTWSNVSSAISDEDIKLYWKHNSTDGSLETRAIIYIKIYNSRESTTPSFSTTETIYNNREPKESNGEFTLSSTIPKYASYLIAGCVIKWKVVTYGVSSEASDASVEREIEVYARPTVSLDITNKNGATTEHISSFPFYLNIESNPHTQTPISYYVEIISLTRYNISDNIGEIKSVNPGDKIYQKYFDAQSNMWELVLEMLPKDIDLKSGANYKVNVSVAMDSGLSANTTENFDVHFRDLGYSPNANISIDKDLLTASINPYCLENYKQNGVMKQRLTNDCLLSIYRREYDGSFTEIASNVENVQNHYVVDPHPSLDYARYRIIAEAKETGTISYKDVNAVKVGETSIVIQWAEEWSEFDYDEIDGNSSVPWEGSLIKLPYNIDTSENKNIDVSLVQYAGRKHPVSYYGTQMGETATWNTEIPASDKDTLYALRRLSRWNGDVYVREPSGTGYWANINVSLNMRHLSTTIPVTFNIKRVEGGI
jgi:hypothetical protein